MKIDNITNQNFYGYKNVISGNNIPIDGKFVSFVSMQLNNDDGFNDLDKYLELRKIQGLPEGSLDEDVLTLTYNSDGKRCDLYLGNTRKPMYWGEELLKLQKQFVPELITEEEYEKIKKSHLRAYTLLTSITKRMMNDNKVIMANDEKEKANMGRVFDSLVKSLSYVLRTEKSAYEAANIGKAVSAPYQIIAGKFFRGINKSMQKLLKA